MPDLSPEEREALHHAWASTFVNRTPAQSDRHFVDGWVAFILAALAAVPRLREVGVEPDLWWPADEGETCAPGPGDLADFIDLEAGHMVECTVARTVGRRWVASLPTYFERDDGWEGGIGWLDGEATDFATEAEARAALEKRKAELLAVVEVATPTEEKDDARSAD